MKIILQRVKQASVTVDDSAVGQIGPGYLLLLGFMEGDTEESIEWLASKVVNVRLFDGEDGKINDRSLLDINGEVLVVSQFTLAGRLEKGNRPDYTGAAKPDIAEQLYKKFVHKLQELGINNVQTGQFGAYMQVELVNDGPVTLTLEH